VHFISYINKNPSNHGWGCIYIPHLLNMSPDKKTVIGFDLYGTLLSTGSVAGELAPHFGEEKA
jgi:hypothetical protein